MSGPVTPTLGLLLLACLVSSGCTKYSERTHARYELGMPYKMRPAEPGGLYQVKWSATPDGPKHAVPGTQRLVRRGDPVGFMRGLDGQVVAMAGDEWFILPPLPASARQCVWSTEVTKQTQFARNMDGVGQVVAGGAMIGGLLALNVMLNMATGSDELLLFWTDDSNCPDGDDFDGSANEDGGKSSGRTSKDKSARGAVPWAHPPKGKTSR